MLLIVRQHIHKIVKKKEQKKSIKNAAFHDTESQFTDSLSHVAMTARPAFK